jgi:hypothetical protein
VNTILRNGLAIILGFITGSLVNMGLVMLGAHWVPPPAGVDVRDSESIRASLHLFEARHFVFPFLAHAVGTWVGALVAFLVAGSRRALFAYVIGGLFLAGGIAASVMIPAPVGFIALDLLLAYLPMAWLATRIGARLVRGKADRQSVPLRTG